MALSRYNRLVSYENEPTDGSLTKGIIISNLPKSITLQELRLHCLVYGNIKNYHIYEDSNEKREAYVTFCNVESAMRALNNRIFSHIDGVKIHRNFENSRKLQAYLAYHWDNTSINALNDDCLLEIFKYLSVAERFKIREVCIRWSKIANLSLQTVRYLDLGFNFLQFLETGYLTVVPYIEELIPKSLENLKKVQLASRKSLFHCTNPVTNALDLILNVHLLAMESKSLIKLIIRSSTNESILSDILLTNQGLKHIEIYENEYILGESLIHLPKTLHTLVIENCSFLKSDHLSAALKKLKNLKSLRLVNCSIINVINIFNEHCQNLLSLQLDLFENNLIMPGRRYAYNLLSITNLKNLRMLKINCNRITDIFLVNLSTKCKELIRLELDSCYNLTQSGINAITALPKLKTLSLRNLKTFSVINIHGISPWNELTELTFTNLHGLRKLHISYCNIPNNEVLTIMQNSPELRDLKLTGCNNITKDIFFKASKISASQCNDVILELKVYNNSYSGRHIIYNGEIY